MSVVRLVPRFVILSAFTLLIVVMIWSCAARNAPGPGPGPAPLVANPCATGRPPASATKQAPIVCVDDSERVLTVFPDPVHVHESKETDRTSPVPIQWYTKSGTGDVHVKMGAGCDSVKVKGCGSGKCDAETTPSMTTPACKYDIWITGGKHDRLDPTVIIDTCCG